MQLPTQVEARFWSKICKEDKPNGCWLWNGSMYKNGYGLFQVQRNDVRLNFLAHRLCYSLSGFELPAKPLILRHQCNVRRCVNPKHLLPGTIKDNARDRESFGVSLKGEGNGQAKLNDEAVREMRKLYQSGLTHDAIAARFGVARTVATRVINRTSWKHVS